MRRIHNLRCLSNRQKRLRKLKYIVYVLMIMLKIKSRKPRRWWVRPWIDLNRGNLHLVHNEFMSTDPEQFQTFLRMNKEAFDKLLTLISPMIKKQDTLMRNPLSARNKLTITLRFLATGETYRSLMYS